jgi:D-alanyl-lipoteichoic acid acyltransferase DltB (MBOAT superfamily)
VHEWLKNYVFMRGLDNKKRGSTTKASLIAFMTSGIWHGFYPGFIFFFFGAFLMDYHQKVVAPVLGPLMKWCPVILQNVA